MPPDLRDTQLAGDLAQAVADFLPGKPHPYGDPSLSFGAAATAAGVGRHWAAGGKTSALTRLFAATLASDRPRFCGLVLEIVRRAIAYRNAPSKSPLTREEVERVNQVVGRIGFKIPELHRAEFLDALPRAASPARPPGGRGTPDPASRSGGLRRPTAAERQELSAEFQRISALRPAERGKAFEPFLAKLFSVHGLDAHGSFRLRGEEIDGSFELDGVTHLLEAKWTQGPIGQSELLVFSGKVESKSRWSRGLFVSFSGFTQEGLDAFGRGRSTNIICLDGLDLHHLLEGALDLVEALRAKQRAAGRTGRAFVPVRELFHGVT